MAKNTLQITVKKQRKAKTKVGRFFQRVWNKIYYVWRPRFFAWFLGGMAKFIYWIFPKSLTAKWDKEFEEEMRNAAIQIVSEDDDLRESIMKGIENGLDEGFDNEDLKKSLEEFVEKLKYNSEDIDPEFNDIVNEKFWDLFDEDKNDKDEK